MLRFLGIGLLLFAFLPFRSTGKNVQDSLWHSYLKTKNPKQKTEIVIRIGEEYDLKNDLVSRDSVFDIALNDIYIKTEDSLLFILYRWYFEKDEEYFTDRASDYAKNFTEIAAKYEDNINSYYSYFAKAKLALYQFNTAQALEYAGQAFYYASLSENIDIKVNAMILLGYSLDWSNKKVEAFRKYIDALYLSKKSEKQDLILKCYNSLASFYYRIYNLGKAKEYVTEQYKILYQQSPLDSLALIRLDITNAHYLFENKERYAAENVAKRILDYTMRHGYEKLEQKIFVVYRTYLIDNGYFKDLSNLYTNQYPNELKEISTNNPTLYYRLKAFILEADGLPDSSEYYYEQAAQKLQSKTNDNVYLSNFFKRYGEFLTRMGKISEAEEKLLLAFQYADSAQYIPYLTELTHELDSLLFSQGKIAEAYQYAKLNLKYNKRAELVQQEEKLLKLEVENEARERELLAQQEAEATARRYNIQYMGISIVIVFSFIILAILGSFKVHKVVVKALGFFSFIFFFEFIIMFADHEIHHFTHGEPWKFMLFKIMLIAILLPLHHWLEEKVIHYLVSHRMVDASRISFASFFGNLKNNLLGSKEHAPHTPGSAPADESVATLQQPEPQPELVITGEPPQTEEKK